MRLLWSGLGWLSPLLLLSSSYSQTPRPSGGTDRSVWFNYFGDQPITARLALHLEGSYRRTLGLTQFEQVMARSGLTFVESSRWQSLIAYTFLLSEPTDGRSFGPPPIAGRQLEHRAFEQQIFEHRLLDRGVHAITLAHRARLEQRWLGTEESGRGVVDWRFEERARYRLTVHLPLGSEASPERYITTFNEVYISFGPHSPASPLYANVTYAAHGWKLSPFWSVELGYQCRFSPLAGGVTGRHDNSLQIYLLSMAPLHHLIN